MKHFPADSAANGLCFGPFRLLLSQRVLLAGDEPVRLGSRALDILITLVERAGDLVTRQELMARVWPDTVVIESNLTVHMTALRRALGEGQSGARYIINVPGRGYSFVAPVRPSAEPKPPAIVAKPVHNLPSRLTRLVGRAAEIDDLRRHLHEKRLVTILGPGGIGKTAVAVAAAETQAQIYPDGVGFIDLSPIKDPRQMLATLASVLQLNIPSDDPLPGTVAALRDKTMLLVFDSCEHVAEIVAAATASILRGAPGVRVLATSREPLGVEGEQLYRLPPLAHPPLSPPPTADQALTFPAVELFVERAAEAMTTFELSDVDALNVAQICRELDGLPLAIELAAARAAAFGVGGLVAILDEKLALLAGGRRRSLERHRTISAALDWSYQLLDPDEQALFRTLSIFNGDFTIEAVQAVMAPLNVDAATVADQLRGLVLKSLAAAREADGELKLRLLETTRAYGLRKLVEHGEDRLAAQRHAVYFRDLMSGAIKPRADFLTTLCSEIANIRAALTWAFSTTGDEEIAVDLAAGSAPVLLHMHLMPECHRWMARALDALPEADRGSHREMVLQSALGLSLMYTQSSTDRARTALERACGLAEIFGAFGWQLQALLALSSVSIRFEEFDKALQRAQQAEVVALRTGDAMSIGRAMAAVAGSLQLCGEFAQATELARSAHQQIDALRQSKTINPGTLHSTYAQVALAESLWMRGQFEQSGAVTHALMAEADAGAEPVSICLGLNAVGCWLWLRLGDLDAADAAIRRLENLSEASGFKAYLACSWGLAGCLAIKRGDLAGAERLLSSSLGELSRTRNEMFATPFLLELAQLKADTGRIAESVEAIDLAMSRVERSKGAWLAEVLRIKGEISLVARAKDDDAAKRYLQKALDTANAQGGLFWELRAAMSLGKLLYGQGKRDEAHGVLKTVYDRVPGGFDTSDRQQARALLAKWSTVSRPDAPLGDASEADFL